MIRAAGDGEIKFVCAGLPYEPTGGCRGIVNYMGDVLQAACLYDHWTPNSANVHIWSLTPRAVFNADFLRAIFYYPFVQSGLGILIAITPADNEASLGFSRLVGFREVGRIKDGWKEDVDLVVKAMRREHCRWVQNLKRAA